MSLADDVRAIERLAMSVCPAVCDVHALERWLPLLTKLGELSPEQATYLVEHCTAIAECDEADARDGYDEHYDPFVGPHPAMTASAHRTAAEVFKMLGGG